MKRAFVISLLVLFAFLFGCTLPSLGGNAKPPPAANAVNISAPPAHDAQENGSAKKNASLVELPASPPEWSADYSLKTLPESANPYNFSGAIVYVKGDKWRLDYSFSQNSLQRMANITGLRLYRLAGNVFICIEADGGWKCFYSKTDTEFMQLMETIADELKNSTSWKELFQLERAEKRKIAGADAECFYVEDWLGARTKECFSPEGVVLYMRSLEAIKNFGTIEMEYQANSYRTDVEDAAFNLPAAVANDSAGGGEEAPPSDFVPRNVSDRIGDGQFRLKKQDYSALRIYVLDAGQADSILVTKGDFAVLIDAGSNVSDYIKKLGIKRLNIVVASRDYAGAIGGLSGILDDFPVDEFWDNGVPAASAEYAALLAKVEEKKITVKHPEAGESFAFSGVRFTALNPQKQRLYGSPESDAIVLKVSMGDFCMLLLNPTVQERERALMGAGESLRCGVITYFMHGEGRPDPSLLISSTSPQYAIISVGQNNSLGLPSATTLTRLQLAGVRVLRTDTSGTIRVTYDGFSPYEIAVDKSGSGSFTPA